MEQIEHIKTLLYHRIRIRTQTRIIVVVTYETIHDYKGQSACSSNEGRFKPNLTR